MHAPYEISSSAGSTLPILGISDYRAAVADAVVALRVHTDRPDDFVGQLDSGGSGDIHLLHIHAGEHAVHRSDLLIARGLSRYYKFSLMMQGTGLIVQEGRETTLQPGDMAIYDTDRPYSLVFGETVRMGIVMFPKELIDLPVEVVRHLAARRLAGDEGVGAMLRPYLSQLLRQPNGLDAHVARRVARSAVDLVSALLGEHAAKDGAWGSHEALTRQILDYIDDRLSVPDLCPTEIAAAHFISVRQLHALFQMRGTSVSATIRTRRLERTYDQLVNPTHADRSVAAIARANGFAEAAHFSRAFRAHYGVPPSAVRAATR